MARLYGSVTALDFDAEPFLHEMVYEKEKREIIFA